MRKHPQSTVVMDAESFRVVAIGRNLRKLSRKLRARKRVEVKPGQTLRIDIRVSPDDKR